MRQGAEEVDPLIVLHLRLALSAESEQLEQVLARIEEAEKLVEDPDARRALTEAIGLVKQQLVDAESVGFSLDTLATVAGRELPPAEQ